MYSVYRLGCWLVEQLIVFFRICDDEFDILRVPREDIRPGREAKPSREQAKHSTGGPLLGPLLLKCLSHNLQVLMQASVDNIIQQQVTSSGMCQVAASLIIKGSESPNFTFIHARDLNPLTCSF